MSLILKLNLEDRGPSSTTNETQNLEKKTAAANDFHHYIISSGDTVYPSTWTCQLKELGCLCGGQQAADREFQH